MPKRTTSTSNGEAKFLRNCSFETLCASWFMQAGWQVFVPLLDHGHCTDLLLSDGPHFYRIQIKTVEATSEDAEVENRWKDSDVQFVAFFAKNSNWGYIIPAFQSKHKRLNKAGGMRFQQTKHSFLKAWHELPNTPPPVVIQPVVHKAHPSLVTRPAIDATPVPLHGTAPVRQAIKSSPAG